MAVGNEQWAMSSEQWAVGSGQWASEWYEAPTAHRALPTAFFTTTTS
jgi:hypothetical protein